MDLISYCRALNLEDWSKSVNNKWTVKDVIAHLVGWEREVALELPKAWNSKKQPWFISDSNYDDFNATSVAYYKDYSSEQLLTEWEKWQKAINNQIERISEDTLRQNPDFGWVFDDGEDGHYGVHYRQIKKALEGTGTCTAVIEIPKGDDRRRHLKYDKSGFIDLGPIKEVIPVNDGKMPVAYGYLENTLNKDENDEVDVLVFSNREFAVGEKVEVVPFTLIIRGDKDHKVLATDATVSYSKWEDIPEAERQLILEYFGHKHKIEKIEEKEGTLKYIENCKS